MACRDNKILLDKENATIYSKGGHIIDFLYINLSNSGQSYSIVKKFGSKGCSKIKLDSLNQDYYILDYLIIINNLDFTQANEDHVIYKLPFIPNEDYKVINVSERDASPSMIEFKTNELGKIE